MSRAFKAVTVALLLDACVAVASALFLAFPNLKPVDIPFKTLSTTAFIAVVGMFPLLIISYSIPVKWKALEKSTVKEESGEEVEEKGKPMKIPVSAAVIASNPSGETLDELIAALVKQGLLNADVEFSVDFDESEVEVMGKKARLRGSVKISSRKAEEVKPREEETDDIQLKLKR